jgi:hypothetical protein
VAPELAPTSESRPSPCWSAAKSVKKKRTRLDLHPIAKYRPVLLERHVPDAHPEPRPGTERTAAARTAECG